jgi:hypothetical protein
VKIYNNDQLCCARAIVTSRAHADHEVDKENAELKNLYQTLCRGDVKRHTAQKVGVDC